MKIEKITFSDWRCFSGSQQLLFSTDPKKPLTVIWGMNGAGKTTTLNAILWAMWDVLTPDFQNPNQLVSTELVKGTPIGEAASSFVEIKFEHRRSKYTLKKTQIEKHLGGGLTSFVKSSTKLTEINEAGESLSPKEGSIAVEHINELLPKSLAKYFFFNGEHFTKTMETDTGRGEFGHAVQHVLGLTKYQRAIKHSSEAAKKLSEQVSDYENNDELSSLERDKSDAEALLNSHNVRHSETNEQQMFREDRLLSIDSELENYEHIRIKTGERNEVERTITAHKKVVATHKSELRRLTSENVALLLLKNHVSEISVLSDQHRARKHIPADFKQSFIADLLSSGSCICGSDLVEGQKHYVQVSSRLQEGAVTGTEEQWNVLANGMKRTEFEFKQFVQKFREAINAVHDEGLEIAALEEELEVISREIVRMSNNVPNPEKIQSLEIERKKVLESIESLKRDKAQLEVLIDQENGKIRKLEKKIEMIIPQNEAAKLAKLQQQYLLGVCDLLKKDLDRIRIEKRFELQEKTTHIFRSLSTLNYSCQLDDNFVLRMVGYSDDSEQLNRAMGTGDTLMMYYSFVAALSKMSLDDAGAEGKNLSFPMMIDAPFTPLDGGPKRRVAENLIGFTHQLAYFCLKDQLVINDSPVVKDKTGRVAVYHYFGSGGGVLSEENIELENQIYPYFSHGKKVEHYSEILVVK